MMGMESNLNISRLVSANTDEAMIFSQALFRWQIPNSKCVGDIDCNNEYTIIIPDVFVRQG